MWPGNTADVKVLVPVVERLKRRFWVREVCVVADRGMISKETIDELEAADPPVRYILGARMRRQKEVSETVLKRRGRMGRGVSGTAPKQGPGSAEGARSTGRGTALRRLPQRGGTHARTRTTARRSWRTCGSNSNRATRAWSGNKGYRRYLKVEGQSTLLIDENESGTKRASTANGCCAPTRITRRPTVALQYKRLWMVEAMFRTTKSILETRPIYHKCDETIRGHVFCTFLALRLKAELEKRLQDRGEQWEWAEVLRGLDDLQEVEASFRGRGYRLRSKLTGHAHKAIRAAGVAVPPTIREV